MKLYRREKFVCGILSLFLASLLSAQEGKTIILESIRSFGGLDVPENQIMNSPVDFTVGSDGRIYVLDAKDHNIKIFEGDGTFVKTFGKKGAGPGELDRPWILDFIKNSLYVADSQNRRIQIFSPEGEYLGGFKAPVQMGTGAAFGPEGRFYLNSRGLRSRKSLAVHDTQGNIQFEFGELEGESFQFFDYTQIKKDIKNGVIPNSSRDDFLLTVAPDGTVWTVYRSLPLAKVHSPEGKLLHRWTVRSPDYKTIRGIFEEKNKEVENQPSVFYPLRYVNDLALDGRGRLHVLLNTPDRMKILVYTREGELLRTCLGPEDSLSSLAFDAQGRLYALSDTSHTIYVFNPGSE
jgi:hypothetical protein